MPINDGRLTEEELAKAVDWLDKQWQPGACPMCHHETWEVLDQLVTPIRYTPGGIGIGGRVIPSIPVICTTCGYTALVNAIVAGIVQVAAKDNPEEKQDG